MSLLSSLLIFSCLGSQFFALGLRDYHADKLGLHNNYNGIVQELIKSWESPIVYLRQLGYLPKDYEDTSKIKPSLDALMKRLERVEHEDQEVNICKKVKRGSQPSAKTEPEVKPNSINYLLQLLEKTKPQTAAGSSGSSVMLNSLETKSEYVSPKSLSTDPKPSSTEIEIEAPQCLNWDINNKKLETISTSAQDKYMDNLISKFVKKQQSMKYPLQPK